MRIRLIEKVEDTRTEDLRGIDLVCAGFPCQNLSVAGRREGLSGSQSGLFFELVRLLESSEVPWVVLENVPGLLSSHKGRDFAIVLTELGKCGYFLAWRILDSRYFGVAQKRRRVFIVGSLRNTGAAEVLFESEGVCRHSAKGKKAPHQIARCLATGTGRWRGADRDTYIPEVSGVLRGSGTGVTGRMPTECAENYLICSQRFPTLQASACGTERTSQRHGEDYIVSSSIDTKRMRTASRFSRRLDECPDAPRYRALGNAVTVQVAEWIARRIIKVQRKIL